MLKMPNHVYSSTAVSSVQRFWPPNEKKQKFLLIALLHEILPAKNLRMLEEQNRDHEKVAKQFKGKAQAKRETENKN